MLRGAEVFVFTSLPTGEGMPGVLIEAGLSAMAVVATDVPGVRSVVQDTVTGFVVDAGDTEAMVDAVARLVDDGDLRADMGAAARRRCAADYSFAVVAACWTGFLTPLVERAGPGGRALRRRRGRSARGTRPGRAGASPPPPSPPTTPGR